MPKFITQPGTSGQKPQQIKPYTGKLFNIGSLPQTGQSKGLLTSPIVQPPVANASSSLGLRAASPTNNVTPPPSVLQPQYRAPQQIPQTDQQISQSGIGFNQLTPAQQALRSGQSSVLPPVQPGGVNQAVSGVAGGIAGGTDQGSGGQANAQNQSPYTVNNGLYGQLIAALANKSQGIGDAYGAALPAYNTAVQNLAQFNRGVAQQIGGIESTPIPLEFQQGRSQVIARQAAQEQAALQGAVQQQQTALGLGLQQQGLQQQALGTAAGLAGPTQVPYGTQYISPLTGQSVLPGGLGGGNFSPQVQAQQYAQDVLSGNRGYADAVGAMGLYGGVGKQVLDEAIRAQNPNFNFAQANTLIAQQGSIKPAYEYAKTALSNLLNSVGQLGTGQNTNIPIINQITQGLSTTFGVGSQAVQAYRGALAEARSAIQKVLASVQGGTPTDYVGQSNALLPDNATPNQIMAAQQTLDVLGQAKVNIYGNPGGSQGGGSGGGSVSAGGYNFVQNAQGQWVVQ